MKNFEFNIKSIDRLDHQKRFTYVYDNKVWGDGSGGGSNIDLLGDLVNWLNNFIEEKEIKSIIDFGCGMSGFGTHLNVNSYIGFDVVESVIKYCTDNFGSENRIYNINPHNSWCYGELLLIKDVLCHWSYKETEAFLKEALPRYKYIVLVNSCNQSEDYQPYNSEPHLHGLGLSYNFEPLKQFNPELIMKLEKNPNDPKEVLLIKNI